MTKRKKRNNVRLSNLGRRAHNARFCPYNSKLRCPLLKAGCPLQDYDFVEDIRFYFCLNSGIKSTPTKRMVDGRNTQLFEKSNFLKIVEISRLFDGFEILDWLSKVIDAPQIRITYVQCRGLRKAYRKWLMHLAPPGHRIIRYQR